MRVRNRVYKRPSAAAHRNMHFAWSRMEMQSRPGPLAIGCGCHPYKRKRIIRLSRRFSALPLRRAFFCPLIEHSTIPNTSQITANPVDFKLTHYRFVGRAAFWLTPPKKTPKITNCRDAAKLVPSSLGLCTFPVLWPASHFPDNRA